MALFFISFISKKRERSFIYFHQRLRKSIAICSTKNHFKHLSLQTSASFSFFPPPLFFFSLKAFESPHPKACACVPYVER